MLSHVQPAPALAPDLEDTLSPPKATATTAIGAGTVAALADSGPAAAATLPAPGRPAHVAIIMDGNGRWAAARGLPRVAGHKAGVEAVRPTVRSAIEMGVGCLTLYAF